MGYYDLIEKMFNEIADFLRLKYQKTTAKGGDVYNFYDKDNTLLVRFTTFTYPDGNINILVNFGNMEQAPISWGLYKRGELMSKAKNEIIIKIKKEILLH